MVRIYAGTLGFLAFFVTTARGVLANGAIEAVLWAACCHLVIFAALGCVIAWLAQQAITESVNGQIADELASRQTTKGTAAVP